MRPRILVLSGVRAGLEFPLLAASTLIGRAAAADISLTGNTLISKRHCIITLRDGGHYLADADSLNGTALNGKTLIRDPRQPLRHGDRITIGRCCTLVYLTEEGTVVASVPVCISDGMPIQGYETTVIERKSALLDTMMEVVGELLSPPDVLREALIDTIFGTTPADRVAILIRDRDREGIEWEAKSARDRRDPAAPVNVSHTVLRLVFKNREAIIVNEVSESGLSEVPSLRAAVVVSIACIPLQTAKGIVGVIYADTYNPEAKFDSTQVHIMTALATMSAIAFENARHLDDLKTENALLREDLDLRFKLLGSSVPMTRLQEHIQRFAPLDSTILILGESGAGKELIARALHHHSGRTGAFVAVNCAAIPATVLESEMFGYEPGAFTGAATRKKGKFELANHGTLFLDEVGELPLEIQPKLLRALQEKEVTRLGGEDPVRVHCRIVAATNVDLAQAVAEGRFRQDLYFRLNVISVTAPPLRDRPEDIPVLAQHFLSKHRQEMKKSRLRSFAESAMQMLQNYRWPGNIRELQNVIERAVALSDSAEVLPEHLPAELFQASAGPDKIKDAVYLLERDALASALIKGDGAYRAAAKLLGKHPNTIHRLVRRYGLEHLLKSR